MKHEFAEARVGILVYILSSTVSRAGRIEDGLNQVINAQFNLVNMPFLPRLEEIIDEAP